MVRRRQWSIHFKKTCHTRRKTKLDLYTHARTRKNATDQHSASVQQNQVNNSIFHKTPDDYAEMWLRNFNDNTRGWATDKNFITVKRKIAMTREQQQCRSWAISTGKPSEEKWTRKGLEVSDRRNTLSRSGKVPENHGSIEISCKRNRKMNTHFTGRRCGESARPRVPQNYE